MQAEHADLHALLARYRELISWRRHISALRDGALVTRDLGNPQLIAWELGDANAARGTRKQHHLAAGLFEVKMVR